LRRADVLKLCSGRSGPGPAPTRRRVLDWRVWTHTRRSAETCVWWITHRVEGVHYPTGRVPGHGGTRFYTRFIQDATERRRTKSVTFSGVILFPSGAICVTSPLIYTWNNMTRNKNRTRIWNRTRNRIRNRNSALGAPWMEGHHVYFGPRGRLTWEQPVGYTAHSALSYYDWLHGLDSYIILLWACQTSWKQACKRIITQPRKLVKVQIITLNYLISDKS